MYKIKHSFQKITPFGGLNFIFSSFSKKDIFKFLDKELGSRHASAKYSYSDTLFSLFSNAICNGEYIADLEHLKRLHSGQLFDKIPSPDTVEYVCKELSAKTEFITGASGAVHQINKIDKMNELLVSLCCRTKLLDSKQKNLVLDYDNMVIENDKYDSLLSYKKTRGYQPGVAFIGRNAVYVENRNGNTPAVYRIVVTRTPKKSQQIDLLTQTHYNYYGIITNDTEKSNKEVIEFYNKRGDESENSNKYLLHDFNMKRLPFSDLHTNTVYMYLMAICNNLFEYLKLLFEMNEVADIQRNSRTKRVFFRYVLLCCKIQKKGRQTVIQIFNGDKENNKPLLM